VDTAKVLNRDLWRDADDGVYAVLKAAGIAQERIEINGFLFQPPAFYFAAPADGPSSPDRYLTSSALPAVRLLTRETIGCDDPRSDQVSGFLAEGNLVFLKREFVFPIEAPQYHKFDQTRMESHHLVLAWYGQDGSDSDALIEWDLSFAALRLAALDIRAALQLRKPTLAIADELGDVERQTKEVLSQEHTLRKLLEQAATEQDRVARNRCFAEMEAQAKQEVRRRPKITEMIRNLESCDRTVSEVIDTAATEAEKAMTFRAVRHLRPVTGELLRSSPAAQVAKSLVAEAKRATMYLGEASEKLSSTIDAVVEFERRENESRAAARQNSLNLLLAGLTGVAALTLVVGQNDGTDIATSVSRWRGWAAVLAFPGRVLAVTFRDALVVVGVVAAALLIAALVAFVLGPAFKDKRVEWRSRRRGHRRVRRAT
jgi:hypothetical protein